MPEVPPSVVNFTRQLIARTRDDTVEWRASPREEDSFILRRRAGRVSVRSRDADRTAPFVLELYNREGVLAEAFVTRGQPEERDEFDQLVGELYEVARGSALNLDKITAEILESLTVDEEEPF